MKAQILYGIGNLKLTDIDKPSPKPGEALIKVTACGICGSDVPRIFKTGAHNMPLIPGHEFTGYVETCNGNTELIGKRVGIFPLIPCMKCPQCLSSHYEMCENYNYLGSRRDGGFAEYVCAPVWNLLPLPDSVTDEEAAMLEPMAVAVHAIRRALGEPPYTPASNIVVSGLGTIGLLTALFLKDAGFTNVICIGNKDIQREKLIQMGYVKDCFCDVRYGDPVSFISEKTSGQGADCYFECIGRSESYNQAVRCTAPLGTVMLVGNPASDMALSKESYWKILRNQLTIVGTWNSSYYGCGTDTLSPDRSANDTRLDDWRYVLTRLSSWKDGSTDAPQPHFSPTDLITHRFSLEDMDKGLDIMRRKSEEYVKIMVKL